MFALIMLTVMLLQFPKCSSQQDTATELQKLTSNRRQHRRTVDGRLCAAAFVQDDQTYTDCTTARAPNGAVGVSEAWILLHPYLPLCVFYTSGGAEWCYVEVQLLGKGPADWNYCLPPIDYSTCFAKSYERRSQYSQVSSDNIRAKARQAFNMKAAEIESMVRCPIFSKAQHYVKVAQSCRSYG